MVSPGEGANANRPFGAGLVVSAHGGGNRIHDRAMKFVVLIQHGAAPLQEKYVCWSQSLRHNAGSLAFARIVTEETDLS
jgi:hypothetical protein